MYLVSPTIYLPFLVTAVFGLRDKFYTLTNVTSWEQANRSCTLATPRINYSAKRINLDFGKDFEGVAGEYWVGYTANNLILQYIGCGFKADVAGWSVRNYTLPIPNPGVCYSACGAGVFGILDVYCYCFETRPNGDVGKHTCTELCMHAGINCSEESVVSIYKVPDLTMVNVTRAPKNTYHCIAYDPSKQAFIWEDCKKSLRAHWCPKSSGHTISTSDMTRTWSESAENCFSGSYTNEVPIDDNTSSYWTAYYRTHYYTHSDRGTPGLYGYVNISSDTMGQPMMRFGNDSTFYNAICIAKERPTTTPENGIEYSKERPTTTPENGIEYLPVKIGVPLLISVCIAVVVAGVICYRRRSNMKRSTQAPDIVEYYSQVQDPYDDAQNVYNEPYEKVIERKSNTSKHGHENRSMPNDEAEYDTTGVVGNIATERRVGDNVYNKLKLVTDDTYDC